MPELDPKQPPPPDYYARNVRYLLCEVQRRNAELLNDDERAFIAAYLGASVPAQRLFARLLSRTGRWIRRDSLHYPEVDDVAAALTELTDAGLVQWLPEAPADALLRLLTRAELAALFPAVRAPTKPDWIDRCLGRYAEAAIRRRIAPRHPWLGVDARRCFAVCQVLFFGEDGRDLSTFVVQDLGILRYERYRLDSRTRAFPTREALDRYLLSRRLSPWSKRLDQMPWLADAVARLLWAPPLSRTEQRARDRVLNRVAYWHERRGDFDAALACYGRATSPPARERRARLLHRLGDGPGVARLLGEIRADPWAAEEEDFAGRFPRRRGAVDLPVSTTTLARGVPPGIERHALHLLTANGGCGWHLENLLPLGLTGLAYWEEIFAPVAGAFSNPFQLGPQDLFWPDFARSRRARLDERTRRLCAPGGFAAQIRRTFETRHGTANRLVHWGAITAELLDALLANVPHEMLVNLVAHTIADLRRARTGFPDLLLVYGPGAWEVVEVKAPTDQLQPAQRTWLRTLRGLGVPARVLRFRAAC